MDAWPFPHAQIRGCALSRRTTCKQCRKVLPIFVALEGDPFCSTECCRKAHGVMIQSHPSAVYADEPTGYGANGGAIGSYAGVGTAQLTRKQREALVRDRMARDDLGLKVRA